MFRRHTTCLCELAVDYRRSADGARIIAYPLKATSHCPQRLAFRSSACTAKQCEQARSLIRPESIASTPMAQFFGDLAGTDTKFSGNRSPGQGSRVTLQLRSAERFFQLHFLGRRDRDGGCHEEEEGKQGKLVGSEIPTTRAREHGNAVNEHMRRGTCSVLLDLFPPPSLEDRRGRHQRIRC